MSAQTQFYKSWIVFGGLNIPIYPGAQLNIPRNYAIPPIVGNYWQFNYGDGFVNPTIDVQIAIRDVATEALSLNFLNLFMTRSADVAHDTSALTGGIVFYNGRRAIQLLGAKADSFSIGSSKGDDIRFSARFCGTGIAATTAPLTPAWSNANILRFNKGTFAGALAGILWRYDLSFGNNHNPDMSLDGTTGPANQNAGMMTVGFNVMAQAVDDTAVSAVTSAALTIAGANVSRTFTLPNLLCETPDNTGITAPRNMVQRSYHCLGGDGQTTAPLTLS